MSKERKLILENLEEKFGYKGTQGLLDEFTLQVRNKAIDECLKILQIYFHRDSGAYYDREYIDTEAIEDIEKLKGEGNE